MPYEIVTNEEDCILVARIWGKASIEEHVFVHNSVAEACVSKGLKRLLVDLSEVDMKGLMTAESRSEFGKDLADDERFKGVAMANILPKDFTSCLDIKFLGAMAASAGKEIGEFTTFDEAKEWLMG